MTNVRKIQKNNQGTYLISIPKDLMRELKFRDNQRVVVKKYGRGIMIEDWQPK